MAALRYYLRCGLWLVLAAYSGSAYCHALQPAYLSIDALSAQHAQVVFKRPAVGSRPLPLAVQVPAQCRELAQAPGQWDGSTFVSMHQWLCDGGLAGRHIVIDGLATSMTDVLTQYRGADETVQFFRLTPDNPTLTIPPQQDALNTAATFFHYGVEHIWLGIDHLLFVLVLVLLVRGWRRLLLTVTAFTVAHSVTLAVSVLGIFTLPQPPVEAMIALSIAFVAAEVVGLEGSKQSLFQRVPWLVAFAFGLLHGLGFASALLDIGFPQQAMAVSLLFFNLGVEAGQVLFIGLLLVLLTGLRGILVAGHWQRLQRGLAYAAGSVAVFWFIERTASIFPA